MSSTRSTWRLTNFNSRELLPLFAGLRHVKLVSRQLCREQGFRTGIIATSHQGHDSTGYSDKTIFLQTVVFERFNFLTQNARATFMVYIWDSESKNLKLKARQRRNELASSSRLRRGQASDPTGRKFKACYRTRHCAREKTVSITTTCCLNAKRQLKV